ncbi:hypothetical protein AKO1_008225 [Acrasis kona]|uniref:UvrD-like helicase C-terminal domain-containing protein n=1 Tax=Acrasis kona TaxID=1008807 RepID=A0AAW2YKD6_9EUKA
MLEALRRNQKYQKNRSTHFRSVENEDDQHDDDSDDEDEMIQLQQDYDLTKNTRTLFKKAEQVVNDLSQSVNDPIRMLCEFVQDMRSIEADELTLEEDDEDDEDRDLVDQKDAITITTIHQSKGLEWDHVMLVRSNRGVCPINLRYEAEPLEKKDPVPSKQQLKQCLIEAEKEHLAEERRLFYVGLTRAKLTVTISCVDDHNKNQPSMFVAEIPHEMCECLKMDEKGKLLCQSFSQSPSSSLVMKNERLTQSLSQSPSLVKGEVSTQDVAPFSLSSSIVTNRLKAPFVPPKVSQNEMVKTPKRIAPFVPKQSPLAVKSERSPSNPSSSFSAPPTPSSSPVVSPAPASSSFVTTPSPSKTVNRLKIIKLSPQKRLVSQVISDDSSDDCCVVSPPDQVKKTNTTVVKSNRNSAVKQDKAIDGASLLKLDDVVVSSLFNVDDYSSDDYQVGLEGSTKKKKILD